jgi:hypothetical protein
VKKTTVIYYEASPYKALPFMVVIIRKLMLKSLQVPETA